MLPVNDLEAQIVASLRERPRLVLSSPTGSGKSTQVPQILLRHGFLLDGQVAVLEPRRLAARMLARRVAEELGVPLGREVGYQVRFENRTSPGTRIRFVTEGVLLRQLIHDPELRGVAALIFDEFHERHLYGDITLARALDLQERRPELRIVVMSATLDLRRLETYLEPCSMVLSEGRSHPVQIEYLPQSRKPSRPRPSPPAWELAASAFARTRGQGDTLVFMPGAYEISRTIQAIERRPESRGHVVLPLHGELPAAQQDAAVAPHDRPRVIVSTNVAETSLTIEGIRVVIDSGLVRTLRHDPHRGINTLLIDRISRASAEQRAGRAGRTAPGRCIRLWSEDDHATRPACETPEVKRLDLAEVILALKASGVDDLRSFRWIEMPDEKALAHGEALLHDLGALRQSAITGLGRRMVELPVHPRYARMLLAAQDLGCVDQALLVVALAQGRHLLTRPEGRRTVRSGERSHSDFDVLIDAYAYAKEHRFATDVCRTAGIHAEAARQVGRLLEQLRRSATNRGSPARPPSDSHDALRKCLLIGFSDRVARRDRLTGRCELVHGRRGTLDRNSVVRTHELLVAAEVREVEGKEISTRLSLATAIDPTWLEALFPEEMQLHIRVRYDSERRRVVAVEERLFRDLPIATRPIDPPEEEAARLLADEVSSGRLRLKGWNDAVEQWILRLDLLARECPELMLPALSEKDRKVILQHLCYGALSAKEIRDRPVLPAVRGWLSPAQQEMVATHAPERLELSNGKRPKLLYAPGALPHIALRIQDLYDVREIPRIALGRVAPVVHVLAPNMRAVQVTQDLAGFWREHYPQVKRELQRRYPKHVWR